MRPVAGDRRGLVIPLALVVLLMAACSYSDGEQRSERTSVSHDGMSFRVVEVEIDPEIPEPLAGIAPGMVLSTRIEVEVTGCNQSGQSLFGLIGVSDRRGRSVQWVGYLDGEIPSCAASGGPEPDGRATFHVFPELPDDWSPGQLVIGLPGAPAGAIDL